MDVIAFINQLITQLMTIAWLIFLVTWIVGWVIKGSPIPFYRVKRTGQSLIEDAVLAAFWLAMGSTVFAIISYITSNVYQPMPPPPTP